MKLRSYVRTALTILVVAAALLVTAVPASADRGSAAGGPTKVLPSNITWE